MKYRCTVCGFTTASDATLARHMASTFNMHEHHLEWMEKRGIPVEEYSPFRSLREQKDFFSRVREVVVRECGIGEHLAVKKRRTVIAIDSTSKEKRHSRNPLQSAAR